MEDSQKKINAQIGLQQKNSILQAWADFKDSIFNVIFVILDKNSQDPQEESLFGLIIQSGFDFLQIIAFIFHPLILSAWNGGESLSGLAKFFGKFNLSNYLPGISSSIYFLMLYSLIFVIVLVIADIVYVSYAFSKKKFQFTFPLILLAQVVPLFVTVFFLPITETLLGVVICQNVNGISGTYMNGFPDVPCYQGWHLFHVVITMLFTFIFVIISSVVALALFEPRMTTKRLTARQNSNAQVIFIFNKICLQFFFAFQPFHDTALYVVLIFLLSFWQFWCYCIKQPYYSKTASKFFKICSTYYFWSSLMLFVGQLLSNYNFDGALIIWVSGLPFFAVIIFFENTSDVNTLFASNLKFKTGDQLAAHLSYVLQLLGTQAEDKNSYMLLIGYIQKHKQLCNQSDCPLKSDKKKKRGDDSIEASCQQVLKQVERMYRSGIKKFPDCTKLRINYAFFQLQHLKNTERAYQQFTAASKLDPDFEQQFNIYRFKKIIRQNLQDRQQNESDLVETIRFQNHVSLLEEAMLLSAKLHKQFWTQLKEQIPDLKKLNTVGAQITETGNTINQNYSQILKINASACQVLYSYAHYLILVSEDYVQGKQLLSNARKIFQDRQSGNKNNQDLRFQSQELNKATNPFLVLSSPSPTAIPKIVNANLIFTQISGYQRQQLIDRQVSKIAPKLFNDEGLSPFALSGEKQQELQGYINHKCNHLIAVQYSIRSNGDGQWYLFFKLASQSNVKYVLLANKQGKITDYNLPAKSFIKPLQSKAQSLSQQLNIRHFGITDPNSAQLRKLNGSPISFNYNEKQIEMIGQVETVNGEVVRQDEGDGQDEEERMIVVEQKELGWRISLNKDQKNHSYAAKSDDFKDESLGIKQKSSIIDEDVLELYNHPNMLDILISNIAQTKQIQQTYNQFKLTQKIKTMRLLNNEIKMVYSASNEGQNTDGSLGGDGEDDRDMLKFDDETYQAKLRSAINTNLNHIQVINLRRASLIFVGVLFVLDIIQLQFQSSQVDTINSYLQQIGKRSNEYSLLSSNIMAAIDGTTNYTQQILKNQNHSVSFNAVTNVNLTIQNGYNVSKNLEDAVVLLNSRLISYYNYNGDTKTITSVFNNYIKSIYPAFLQYPTSLDVDMNLQWVVSGLVLFIALMMMCYWIYISLNIDKKRYDIMIWFLDIPVPYVTHLGNHCDKYLKQFISVKELSQKGLLLQQQQDSYEEYSTNKKNNANDEEQIQQQIKARKSLITKNKKQTLISKINLSSLKVIWVLIYALFFSTLILVFATNFFTNFTFLNNQWVQTSKSIIVDNTLYVTLQMQKRSIYTTQNLQVLATTLKKAHKGVITTQGLESFNYNILTFSISQVSAIYNTVYYSNLCNALPLQSNNLTLCKTLVGTKLVSGYEVYSKYLITPQATLNDQIRKANQYFVVPALLVMLNQWQTSIKNSGVSLINLCTIILYIFIILSVLSFLTFWLYYLRKLNTELNQTIQMLNMIPFKLLPKSRKQTKVFITWIIREANKTKHQQE